MGARLVTYCIGLKNFEDFDLGPVLYDPGSSGEIHFIDGECPGNHYPGVNVADDLSLSLLQERLIQHDQGVV